MHGPMYIYKKVPFCLLCLTLYVLLCALFLIIGPLNKEKTGSNQLGL